MVATLALPLALPALAVADLIRGRRRLPSIRVYLFALQYLLNDSAEILLAGPLWLAAGMGTGLGRPASINRHRRLQQWSLDLLERRAAQLLGLRVETAGPFGPDRHRPGPVIVISRHVSLFDASLPGIVYHRAGYAVRGVIMAELLADPGFDLLYSRLGSVFIPRDGGPAATEAIATMVDGAARQTAYGIFPEGRLFRPEVLDRSLTRLSQSDPERAERLSPLRNLLPPRPGGLLALLDALPTADVVLLDHRGLDRYRHLTDFASRAPVDQPITVTARLKARADIPDDRAGRIRWLDDLWLALDQELQADLPNVS